MEKKKGITNITVSIIGKFIILISTLLTRRLIIKYLGNEINGINSLYASIIGFLSVAELGIGTAITFSMYKPIVEGKTKEIAALYQLYRRIYIIIGTIIGIVGIIVIPFLPMLAKDYKNIGVNFSTTFFLSLLSVVLSYGYSAKISLINAYKNNYLTSISHTIGIVIQTIIQIIVLKRYQSFELFLIANILGTIIQWILTNYYAKSYSIILNYKKTKIDDLTKHEIIKNIKAMFMHKIGTILVNSTDSIIISSFIGVVILGKYTNYTTLITGMVSVLILFFTSVTSIVGHMFVTMNKKEMGLWFDFFYNINYILGVYCFLGFYAIINDVISILFGDGLQLNRGVVMIIVVNYFIQFMRQAALLFRDASGTFYYDRWKPIVEGIVNIIFSLFFVIVLPENYKMAGVILATIITNIMICHIVEPYVVYKYALGKSAKRFIIKNYFLSVLFILGLIIFDYVKFYSKNIILRVVFNGIISVVISSVIILLVLIREKNIVLKIKEFKRNIKRGDEKL